MIWEYLAYAGRYGHQPLDVSMRMSIRELRKFNKAVSGIVKEENEKKG